MTILISTNTSLRTPFLYLTSIRSLTRRPDVSFSLFLIYSRYHQIALKESDQEKTSFITPFGAYCYNTMTFGLKNTGATYQKAIQKCLQGQIGRNAEAYVDDVVIKTKM